MTGGANCVTALHPPLLTMQPAYGQEKKSPAQAEVNAYVGYVSATPKISASRADFVNMTNYSVLALLDSSAMVSVHVIRLPSDSYSSFVGKNFTLSVYKPQASRRV